MFHDFLVAFYSGFANFCVAPESLHAGESACNLHKITQFGPAIVMNWKEHESLI